jgi:hypothetical protein
MPIIIPDDDVKFVIPAPVPRLREGRLHEGKLRRESRKHGTTGKYWIPVATGITEKSVGAYLVYARNEAYYKTIKPDSHPGIQIGNITP